MEEEKKSSELGSKWKPSESRDDKYNKKRGQLGEPKEYFMSESSIHQSSMIGGNEVYQKMNVIAEEKHDDDPYRFSETSLRMQQDLESVSGKNLRSVIGGDETSSIKPSSDMLNNTLASGKYRLPDVLDQTKSLANLLGKGSIRARAGKNAPKQRVKDDEEKANNDRIFRERSSVLGSKNEDVKRDEGLLESAVILENKHIEEEKQAISEKHSLFGQIDEGESMHEKIEDLKDREYISPHDYQLSIYDQIEQQWFVKDNTYGFGSIVFMPTGSGKTLVAIMLILRLFGMYNPTVTGEQRVRVMSQRDLEKKAKDAQEVSVHNKKVAFLVPTTNLVDQQAEAISKLTELKVGKFSGQHQRTGGRQLPGDQQHENWRMQLATFDVFVFTQKKLYDILMHGLMKLDEFDMIVFDECHHADQSHYYNLIMSDFFFYKFNLPDESGQLVEKSRRPFVLGLTASPLKSKVGDSTDRNITSEIRGRLQTLSNNLYSRFVSIDETYISELESRSAAVEIRRYNFEERDKVNQVQRIAEGLIKKLLKLIPLDERTMKVDEAVLHGINSNLRYEDPSLANQEAYSKMGDEDRMELLVECLTIYQFEQQQDEQVVKFLKKRHEFISLDIDYVKAQISLRDFPQRDDKILLIYCIVLLKNANNLILELGPLAFDYFAQDEQKQLLERMQTKSRKTQMANKILSGFIDETASRNTDQVAERLGGSGISNKVKKLVAILNSKTEQLPLPKVIIFVKDRVVAHYLQRILVEMTEQSSAPENSGNSSLLYHGYRVAVAMSPKGKNLLNKAYSSFRTKNSSLTHSNTSMIETDDTLESQSFQSLSGSSDDINEFRSMLGSIEAGGRSYGRQAGVKISSTQLRDVLAKFREGSVNVLIATNVIEEGLDVSECNLVICLNELFNVKAFIQMKGRARKQDSKFVFLCADKDKEVEKDRVNFGVIIDKMKELAFNNGQVNSIQPEVEKLRKAKVDVDDYFEVEKTGARVSLRDAKSLIEVFCEAAAEVTPTSAKVKNLENPEDTLKVAVAVEPQTNKKLYKYVTDFKPFFRTQETAPDAYNKKFFLTALYMPKSCLTYLEDLRFKPESGFLKKKDSENHVAQIALRKLYSLGYLDDYLYPKIGIWKQAKKPKTVKLSSAIPPAAFCNVHSQSQRSKKELAYEPTGSYMRRRAQITEKEQEEQRKDASEFERTLKSSKSKIMHVVEDKFRSLIKEKLDTDVYPMLLPQAKKSPGFQRYPSTLYIHCLRGAGNSNMNNFPFRTTKTHIGILFSRQFKQENTTILRLCQEKKSKEKNYEYLEVLKEAGLIDQSTLASTAQNLELIQLELSPVNMIELDFKEITKGKKRYIEVQTFIQKLKFFHTWLFYYFYSADQKFLKNLIKCKFQFSKVLFEEELTRIYSSKKISEYLKKIYCPDLSPNKFKEKYERAFLREKRSISEVQIYPFVVPLVENNQLSRCDLGFGKLDVKNGLHVDMRVIDQAIQNVREKLLDIIYLPSKRDMRSYLSLESPRRNIERQQSFPVQTDQCRQHDQELVGVWDDRFTGVRYVKLEQISSQQRWDLPILHLENRANALAAQQQDETLLNHSQYQSVIKDFEAVQSNFSNCSARQILIKNNQRRLDIYSVAKYNFDKYGLLLSKRMSKNMYVVRKERHFVDFSKFPKAEQLAHQQVESSGEVSSKFDVVQELLRHSPLTYEQYQVYQQSCTHLLFFNEFLQVEKFIYDKFAGHTCFLQPKDDQIDTDQPQFAKQRQHLQSILEPAPESRDVFREPNASNRAEHRATDQLLNNIHLVMEALTAPNANRSYDYERLEFYGDSVISFLVILELFISKSYTYKEGPLDFYRIKKVSNMHFFWLNQQHGFYKYMINEPQTIFNDFVPGAFENLKYQERIKHKTLNELNNKVKYLRRERLILENDFQLAKAKNNLVPKAIACRIHKEQYGIGCGVSSISQDRIYKRERNDVVKQPPPKKSRNDDHEVLKELGNNLEKCISKIQEQKEKRLADINATVKKNVGKRTTQGKQFFYKQLADVIESVTGAAMIACGLNLTQSYLRSIGVLDFSQTDLKLALAQLKQLKETNRESRGFVNWNYAHGPKNMVEVERKLGYTFKNKLWLIEALTHKSYVDQSQASQDSAAFWRMAEEKGLSEGSQIEEDLPSGSIKIDRRIDAFDDYERLEFLGDAILNFMIAEYFFSDTIDHAEKKMPKELHKMKTSVINNALLSLIVIENGIHDYVLYNERANAFKLQFEEYVERVHELLAQLGGSTKDVQKALDLDDLYEKTLKIFGDVFESLIGAVFIDSCSMETTWNVLYGLMRPYLGLYSNLQTLQDHSRTKLLELWNQKDYMKNFKCHHETRPIEMSVDRPNRPKGRHAPMFLVPESGLGPLNLNEQCTVFRGMVENECVLEVPYDKDAKNKVRNFYRHYYEMMSKFFEWVDNKKGAMLAADAARIAELVREFTANTYKPE